MLKFFAPYLLPASGALLVFALLFGGAQTFRMNRAKSALAELQQVIATERAMAQAAALAAEKEARAIETQWIEAVQEAENVKAKERARGERIAAGLRNELAGLRVAIDEYAAGSSGATPDTVYACHERAAALGRFVADGLRVQEALADRAETCAADLRSMRNAWPRVD